MTWRQQDLQAHYLVVCVLLVMYGVDIPLMGVSFVDGVLLVGVSLGGGVLCVGHSIQFTVNCTTYTEMKH